MKRIISLVMAISFLCVLSIAAGETISFSGTIAAKSEIPVLADRRGKVSVLEVNLGETVEKGQTIVTLATEKLYCPADGTVSLLSCKPGDSASAIIERYGALMYVEDRYSFEITASIDSAYNTADNKLIHPGETVRVICGDNKHSGTGFITRIDRNQYNVLITSGMFVIGESVNIYRSGRTVSTQPSEEVPEDSENENETDTPSGTDSGSAVSSDRIGRGVVGRITPYAITGTGNVVRVYTKEGARVKSGDILCEIIDAGISGYSENPDRITAKEQGVVGKLNVSPGDEVNINDVIAVIYPSDEVMIRGRVSEFEVQSLAVNDEVEIEMLSNQGTSRLYQGVITGISFSSFQNKETNDGSVTFEVYVDFDTDDPLYYGMSAIVNVNK